MVKSELLDTEYTIRPEELGHVHCVVENPVFNGRTGERRSFPHKQCYDPQGWRQFLSTGGMGYKIQEMLHLPEGLPANFEEYAEEIKERNAKKQAARQRMRQQK